MPGSASREVWRYIEDGAVAGVEVNAVAKTATWNSEWFSPKDFDLIGLLLILTVTGTSPTLDVKLQMSEDGGTTARDVWPDAVNTESTSANTTDQALMAQKTATGVAIKFFPNWLTISGAGSLDPKARFVFTIGGTNPSFTTSAILILKYAGATSQVT